MGNMSYCRFQNTEEDFYDCLRAIENGGSLSPEEHAAMLRLVELAEELLGLADADELPRNQADCDEEDGDDY